MKDSTDDILVNKQLFFDSLLGQDYVLFVLFKNNIHTTLGELSYKIFIFIIGLLGGEFVEIAWILELSRFIRKTLVF